MSTRYVLLLTIPVTFALVVGIATGSYLMREQPASAQQATVLEQPRALPELQLVAGDGSDFGLAQLRGDWHLLFFGFANCPDICPNTLALLNQVHKRIGQRGRAPGVVFVSVDPGRDKPAELAEYVDYFNTDFTGVTGPLPQIRKLTGALYLPFSYAGNTESEDYQVNHSAAVVLIDPEARAVAYLTPPHQAERMAADIAAIMDRKG